LKTFLLRLDDKGDPAGAIQQLNERGVYTQLIAGIGGPYLLVGAKWGADFSSCAGSLVGRLVTSSGVSEPFVVYDAGGVDIADFAVAPDGNGFQVVWVKRLGTFPCPLTIQPDPPTTFYPSPPLGLAQMHIGQDGSSGTPSIVAEGSGFDQQPSVARNAAAELLVWIDTPYSGNPSKIAAAIVHPGGPVVPISIASSAATEIYSSVAASESTFMTAWVEGDPFDGASAVYAKRFGTDGRAIDAAPIKVSADNQVRNYAPVVAFDGTVWLFLWSGIPHASVRRMAADGTWIDAAPFAIGPTDRVFDYAVASNGNGFAVLTFAAGPLLSLTFIPRTGEARQLPIAASGLNGYNTPPSMAWDGNGYVAVWSNGYGDYIEGIRFDQDGQVLTPLFTIDRSPGLDDFPSVACHAGVCAAAWQSNDSIAAAILISGTVIHLKTTIDAAAPNTIAAFPRVLATHDGFQLFWAERGSATPSLFTASMTSAGIDPRELLGAVASYGAAAAAITPRGQLALTMSRPANDPAYGGVTRAFLRLWPAVQPEPPRRRAVGR
jgi:hypothetical protein